MAFEVLSSACGREAKTNQVGVWVGSNGIATVVMSGDVYERIGGPSFAKIAIGTKQHSGFVAIYPKNIQAPGLYKVTKTGPSARQRKIAISAHRINASGKPCGTTPVPFEITDDGMIIDVRSLAKPALQAAE